MAFFTSLLIGLAFSIASYLIQPRPKQQKPPESSDLASPTASASREIPKVWGSMRIKSPNILWYGEKSKRDYKIKVKN